MSQNSSSLPATPLLERLSALAAAGKLRQIDLQLARLLLELGGEPELALAAAMVSFELGKGHVCLPLPASRCFELGAEQQAQLLRGQLEQQRMDWQALNVRRKALAEQLVLKLDQALDADSRLL